MLTQFFKRMPVRLLSLMVAALCFQSRNSQELSTYICTSSQNLTDTTHSYFMGFLKNFLLSFSLPCQPFQIFHEAFRAAFVHPFANPWHKQVVVNFQHALFTWKVTKAVSHNLLWNTKQETFQLSIDNGAHSSNEIWANCLSYAKRGICSLL